MSGIPKRKPSISKASRAQGEYSIGAPAAVEAPSVDSSPALTIIKPEMPAPNTVKQAPVVKASVPFVDTDLTREALLATPVMTTNISLDSDLNGSIRRLRIELRKQGYRVTIGALVSFAMAAAFEKHSAWIHEVEPDARRTQKTKEQNPQVKRRTSLNLPSGLPAAAELLVWRLSENDSAGIPSITSVQTAALRWGIAHQEIWLPELLQTKQRPVRS